MKKQYIFPQTEVVMILSSATILGGSPSLPVPPPGPAGVAGRRVGAPVF